MPKPHQRTRSRKRVHKASPGGVKKTLYRRGSTSQSRCALCGKPLAGIPHDTPAKIRKLSRSKRRVCRLHGGQLCPSCLKKALTQTSRTLQAVEADSEQ